MKVYQGKRALGVLLGVLLAVVVAAVLATAAAALQAQSSSSSFANAGSSGSATSGSASSAPLQLPSIPSPPANALYGSVMTAPPSSAVLPLSLDDAIRRGLQHNLQMAIGIQNQRLAAGERLEAVYYLMPSITWQAERSRNQIDLAAEGFRPSIFSKFPSTLFPPSTLANFPNVVTANVVSAKATLRQTLFDLKSFELYRAAKQEILAVNDSVQSSRQDVIQTVADSYLVALADAANVANAKSLLATNAEILRETTLEHQAGTVAKLDELRARVQYQQQQQVVIAQQDTLEKAKVALNREIGLAADQPIELTDETPFETLDVMPLSEALQEAYANRQDYRQLQAELRSAEFQRGAARFERLPTLSFDGNYGVVGAVGGVYHGTFQAEGVVNISLSRLAKFRGDRDIADAAVTNATSQLANLRSRIEAQLRDSMLDISAAQQLVGVGRSNVGLAHTALNDTRERFDNGIDTNLPVVEAQATLAAAEAQLVNSLYQYNQAKLGLARNIGIIDRQYRAYLGSANQTAASGGLRGVNRGALTPAEYDQGNGQ